MRSLLSLIVPPLCAVCAQPCDPAEDACSRCLAEIRASKGGPLSVPGVQDAWAATAYEGAGRRLVVQLKFGGRLRLARVAASLIRERMPAASPGAVLVPVPADPLRRRIRGFDPADRIAAELGRSTGLTLARCLGRHHGRRQVGRSRVERFATGPEVRLLASPPAAAVLVDDVVTTGSTLAACARTLRAGGCAELLAVAFARA